MADTNTTTTTDTTTGTTTGTTTQASSLLDTVKTTVKGWFGNEIVKVVAAGVGGLFVGYTVRLVQKMFSKSK